MNKNTLVAVMVCLCGVTGLKAETERLTNTRDTYPWVSPDGKRLVFQSNRTGSDQVFIMNIDGSDLKQLTAFEKGAETPAFSPDGLRIVFAAYVAEDNNDVFVINTDGSGLSQLTHGPGYDGHPHWSFDGTRIVFNSDRTSPDPKAAWGDRWHEIFSMKANGSDVAQHTRCESVCTFGSLSPDGKALLYRKVVKAPGLNWMLEDIEKNSEIFVSDPDGKNEINLSKHKAFDGWPTWAPDGKSVAFASNRSGPALTGQVWVLGVDGSGLRQVSEGPWSHAQPSWGPDGRTIYAYQFTETASYEFGSIVRIN